MKKIIISIIILMVILAAAISFLTMNYTKKSITGEVVKENIYSSTKAICDKTNYCEDYEITCNNDKVTDIKSTGYSIQHSTDWEDPRDESIKDKLCE